MAARAGIEPRGFAHYQRLNPGLRPIHCRLFGEFYARYNWDGSHSFDIVMDNMSKIANIAKIMKTLPTPIDPILGELRVFDASTVKNKFREVAAQTANGAVAISRYSRPELVIMTAGEYVRLEKLRRTPLDALTGQFDELVAKMQTAKSKNAVQALFEATSADLGKAALSASKANAR
jgi:hypothetical protein